MAVTMLFSLFLVETSALTTSEFGFKLSQQRNSYPHGSTWNGSFNGGIQCFGYAHMTAYNVFGTYANSWTKVYSLDSVKAGDVVQYGNTSGSGHTIFVTDVSGDIIYYTDCNSDLKCTVKWDQHISKSNKIWSYSFSYLYSAPALTSGECNITVQPQYTNDVHITWTRPVADANYWVVLHNEDGSVYSIEKNLGNVTEHTIYSVPFGKYYVYIEWYDDCIKGKNSSVFNVYNDYHINVKTKFSGETYISWNTTATNPDYWLSLFKEDGTKYNTYAGLGKITEYTITNIPVGKYYAYLPEGIVRD